MDHFGLFFITWKERIFLGQLQVDKHAFVLTAIGYGIDWEVQKSCLDSLRLFEVTLLADHQLSSPAYVMSVFLGSSLAIFSSSPMWF